MKKMLIGVCIICVVAASCTSTRIMSSWSEPNKSIVLNKLNKVLAVALLKNETNNRKAEDQMIERLNGKGIVSYSYLNTNFNNKNELGIRDKIKLDGFDGVVTMRLIDVDKERTYTPGKLSSYPLEYRTFSGYYYRTWNTYSTPGYYATTKTYTIEINVFSIKEDKIIWTGLTQTTDPDGVNKMTADVVRTVFKKMKKDGFISK
jgi:hypothetical protein